MAETKQTRGKDGAKPNQFIRTECFLEGAIWMECAATGAVCISAWMTSGEVARRAELKSVLFFRHGKWVAARSLTHQRALTALTPSHLSENAVWKKHSNNVNAIAGSLSRGEVPS